LLRDLKGSGWTAERIDVRKPYTVTGDVAAWEKTPNDRSDARG
jgi:hypothetical protein